MIDRIDPTKDWPFGDYMGPCRECEAVHTGPKRRPCCWKCLTTSQRHSQIMQRREQHR